MDSKLCDHIYFVKTNSDDKLEDKVINYLKVCLYN